MKPFSLDEYNKNKDLPIVTRDGRPARIISTKIGQQDYPICAIVESINGDTEEVVLYTNDGRRTATPKGDVNNFNYYSVYDLFFDVEEPKQCDFKPFDQVLVRDEDTDNWLPHFFRKPFHSTDGALHFVTLNGRIWSQCIPYNEETAGLIDTNKPAPSKYAIW